MILLLPFVIFMLVGVILTPKEVNDPIEVFKWIYLWPLLIGRN